MAIHHYEHVDTGGVIAVGDALRKSYDGNKKYKPVSAKEAAKAATKGDQK